MELKTLFKRESVADPFFIRFVQTPPNLSKCNSGVISDNGGLENRFQRNCGFKNGGVIRKRKKPVINDDILKSYKSNFNQQTLVEWLG